MEYIVTTEQKKIDFAPITVVEEVLQNVRCIMETTKFSVPLDRDFGIDADALDMPIDIAKAKLMPEIFMAIAKYEPRATVIEISWDGELQGILRPKVQVRIDET